MALTAPTTVDASQRSTTAPPAYRMAEGLSSTASHCFRFGVFWGGLKKKKKGERVSEREEKEKKKKKTRERKKGRKKKSLSFVPSAECP